MSVDERSTSSKDSSKTKDGPNHIALRLSKTIIESQTGTMQKFLKISKLMVKLRDRIVTGEYLDDSSTTALLCTSTEAFKTLFLTPEHHDNYEPLKKIVPLLFTLLCGSKENRDLDQGSAASSSSWTMDTESMNIINTVEGMSAWDRLQEFDKPEEMEQEEAVIEEETQQNKKQRKGTPEQIQKQIEEEQERERVIAEAKAKAIAWKKALAISDSDIANATIKLGCKQLNTSSEDNIERLSHIYFRATIRDMTSRLLMQGGDIDVCTLGSSGLASMSTLQRDEQLLTIAQGAESEAGQQIARDLNLSFQLPPSHIGMRRTLLITRACSTRAGVDFPQLVQRSHEVAMAGCEWIWLNSTSNIERMCAILAGVAVWTTTAGEDPIRKCDAFGGRVQLPFFETSQPIPKLLRITLIPQFGRWVLYRISERDGEPRIMYSQKGFHGLCNCLIQLVDSIKKENKKQMG